MALLHKIYRFSPLFPSPLEQRKVHFSQGKNGATATKISQKKSFQQQKRMKLEVYKSIIVTW